MKYTSIILGLFALILICLSFILQGHIGINLWDEGWLWHGTRNVLKGEIPIRDFSSYDPGRYYWSAIFLKIIGNDGLIAQRIAVAIFQFFGLFTGILLIAKIKDSEKKSSLVYALMMGFVLLFWMFPRHKLFDISLSIILVFVIYNLVSTPSKKNYLITGLFVGIAAVFGRNHGVYSLFASTAAIVWINFKQSFSKENINHVLRWAFGILLGFSPVIFLIIFAQNFGIAFYQDVKAIFDAGTSNPLVLPIPWPWTLDLNGIPFEDGFRRIIISSLFLALICFGLIGLLWLFVKRFKNQPVNPVLAASTFCILPYMHHAYSRSDVGHLSQGVFPLLFLFITIVWLHFNNFKKSILALLILCLSVFTTIPYQEYFIHKKNQQNFTSYKILSDTLLIYKQTALELQAFDVVKKKYTREDNKTFVALPYLPGFYAIYNQKAPVNTLSLYPKSLENQSIDIEKLKNSNPAFIFLWNHPLDGIEDRRYSNSHSLVYKYITDNFVRKEEPGLEGYELFIAKSLVQ